MGDAANTVIPPDKNNRILLLPAFLQLLLSLLMRSVRYNTMNQQWTRKWINNQDWVVVESLLDCGLSYLEVSSVVIHSQTALTTAAIWVKQQLSDCNSRKKSQSDFSPVTYETCNMWKPSFILCGEHFPTCVSHGATQYNFLVWNKTENVSHVGHAVSSFAAHASRCKGFTPMLSLAYSKSTCALIACLISYMTLHVRLVFSTRKLTWTPNPKVKISPSIHPAFLSESE